MINGTERVVFNVATDASGDFSETKASPVHGLLHAVALNDIDLDAGADITLSVVGAEGITTALLTLTDVNTDKVYYPTVVEQDATGGDRATTIRQIVSGYLKLVVAQGGNTKTAKVAVHLVAGG